MRVIREDREPDCLAIHRERRGRIARGVASLLFSEAVGFMGLVFFSIFYRWKRFSVGVALSYQMLKTP
jgi:hypothetical protein